VQALANKKAEQLLTARLILKICIASTHYYEIETSAFYNILSYRGKHNRQTDPYQQALALPY
jgi:hypothetical protein